MMKKRVKALYELAKNDFRFKDVIFEVDYDTFNRWDTNEAKIIVAAVYYGYLIGKDKINCKKILREIG
jgi:hypothetical protein